MNAQPTIAITMGDGAGIGPEIIMAALAARTSAPTYHPVVIGDARRLEQAAQPLDLDLRVRRVEAPREADGRDRRTVDVMDLGLLPRDLAWGELSAVAGNAAYRYICKAVDLARLGEVDAICTAPLNKEAMHAAGHRFPGHTELLAHLSGVDEVSMMLVAGSLRVIHVTTHMGLLDAIEAIDAERVERTIRRGHAALMQAGLSRVRIGVCGINPHAGEGGLFGRGEEAEKIEPAVAAARADGMDVAGPLPADSAFFLASRGDYDLLVAMYHDQGHGPIKVLGIDGGVNVTVGLPVVRTSVDHGTAFDIAGRGVADARSMAEALRLAVELAGHRHRAG